MTIVLAHAGSRVDNDEFGLIKTDLSSDGENSIAALPTFRWKIGIWQGRAEMSSY